MRTPLEGREKLWGYRGCRCKPMVDKGSWGVGVVIGKSDGLTNHISSVKTVAIPRVVTCRHSTISSL